MNSQEVKALLLGLGADLCGIAGVDRFGEAPAGFHPRDVCPYSLGADRARRPGNEVVPADEKGGNHAV